MVKLYIEESTVNGLPLTRIFYKRMYGRFAGPKKSGRNNEVAARRGSIVFLSKKKCLNKGYRNSELTGRRSKGLPTLGDLILSPRLWNLSGSLMALFLMS